ncbi:MAG: glycosyl hydrolase 115 family protein [Cyclobacteriaceae bacterium]
MRKTFIFLFGAMLLTSAIAQNSEYISSSGKNGHFRISNGKEVCSLLINSTDYLGVVRAFGDLQSDINKVVGIEPAIEIDEISKSKYTIIAGTIGTSALIDDLIKRKVIDEHELSGKLEKFIIKTVKDPFPGIENGLIIAGSDKRGTIYGIYDLSENMGVSPWYWWADVPVAKKEKVFVIPGTYTDGEPAIKYRGIFINDEAPAFRNWSTEKFGGQNRECYEKIFELILRNKANYLWPAMWIPSMFNVDDPLNAKTADEFGVVMATTHHEPMMRAHNEWYVYGDGDWNYETNKEKLQGFWRGGIERMGDYESVVTVGMRGDGDEAMTEETAIDLMQTIIADQREIIADVTGKPAEETPQVWAVYKEVQDYYDKGLRVDDDIIVLFCDDNWGNLRILPKKEDLNRKAGYGLYYHFDYVGAPVSYRWHNVTQIERTWEQMHLAYEHGIKDLWLVNVGDIKPMEFPISFFLDYAWNPDAIQANDLPDYYTKWVQQQFGEHYTNEIAELIALYTKYNARCTPEMLKPNTYSLENYREAERIVDEFNQLVEKSNIIYEQLPKAYQSAFYQLVSSPIEMCANLNELYVTTAKNNLYAHQGRVSANLLAEQAKELFEKDSQLTREFHVELENGKWNHMMSQTHIGYTSWNHPRANIMPAVSYIEPDTAALLGFAVEHGSAPSWGGFSVEGHGRFSRSFETFDSFNQQEYYIDIFNRGSKPGKFTITPQNDWIIVSKDKGTVSTDERVTVKIDWDKAPREQTTGEISIQGDGLDHAISVPILNDLGTAKGFIENNGVISMNAPNYTRKTETSGIRWTEVPNLGRTHSSMIAEPVNVARQELSNKSSKMEFEFTLFDHAEITVHAYLSPTQDFRKSDGLKFAVSIDDEAPQVLNMNANEEKPDYEYADWWMKSVADHIKTSSSKHNLTKGNHTLKIWMIDPGIVFQKFVIDAGGLRPSYLGPKESIYIESED